MPSLELEGKIVRKLPLQSGTSARGPWARQDFVLEYQDGNYPAQACITAFGEDRVKELDKYGEGDSVRVAFNIRAREYNGRWYNDIRAWRFSAPGVPGQNQGYAQPGYSAGYGQAPAPVGGYGPVAPGQSQGYAQAPSPAGGYGPATPGQTQGYAPAQQAPAPPISDLPAEDGSATDDLPF